MRNKAIIALSILFMFVGASRTYALSSTCTNCDCSPSYAAQHGFVWQSTGNPVTQAEADCYDRFLSSECTGHIMGSDVQVLNVGTPSMLHKVERDACTDPNPPKVEWDWTKENGWEVTICITGKYQSIVAGIGWSLEASGCYKKNSKTSVHFGGEWAAGEAPCSNPWVALMKRSDNIKVTTHIMVTKTATYDMGWAYGSSFCESVWDAHGCMVVSRDDCGTDNEISYTTSDTYTLKTDPGDCPEKCDCPCLNDKGGC
jgi:hypothetical protein